MSRDKINGENVGNLKYRHLCYEDKKILEKQIKFFNLSKKTICFISSIFLIMLIFAVGIVLFYIFIDNKTKSIQNPDLLEFESNGLEYVDEEDRDFEKSLEEERDLESEDDDADENFESYLDKSKKSKEDIIDHFDFSSWNKSCPEELVVVNRENKLDDDYVVDIKLCRGKEVNVLAWENLEKMIQDAAKDGAVLWISSGYRSRKYQEKLFNEQVKKKKSSGVSQEEAEFLAQSVVSKPGMSEHNTGLAVDFNGVYEDFYKTKEYKWLMDNASKYGFIERYQKKWIKKTGVMYEPWHFRYVGDYAQSIKESNLCLEDYIRQNLI